VLQADGLMADTTGDFHRAISKVDDCLSLVMSTLTQECDAAKKLQVMSDFFGFSVPCECFQEVEEFF